MRHRSVYGFQKMSVSLKVPKNTVASIILKWKKYGTTNKTPRSGQTGRRVLVREVTKNPLITLTEL